MSVFAAAEEECLYDIQALSERNYIQCQWALCPVNFKNINFIYASYQAPPECVTVASKPLVVPPDDERESDDGYEEDIQASSGPSTVCPSGCA